MLPIQLPKRSFTVLEAPLLRTRLMDLMIVVHCASGVVVVVLSRLLLIGLLIEVHTIAIRCLGAHHMAIELPDGSPIIQRFGGFFLVSKS